MASFLQRVQNYVGVVADTTALSDWLTAGARTIVELLPDDKARKSSTYTAVTDSGGILVNHARIISVEREGYGARQMPDSKFAQVVDADSIHYATATDPVYIIQDKKCYLFPVSTNGKIHWIPYPTVLYTDEFVDHFPQECENLVVLYASTQYLIDKMGELRLLFPSPLPTPALSYTPIVGNTLAATSISTNAAFSIDLASDITTLLTYISGEEDFEKARAQAEAIQVKLGEFERESTLELQRVRTNAELAQQAATVTAQIEAEARKIETAQSLQSGIATFAAKINKYVSEVQGIVNQIQGTAALLKTLQDQYLLELKMVLGMGEKPQ